MKKLNSLAFKLPLSISFISSIIIIILLVISLFFSSKGITESINVGFRNTVEGYAYLLDAVTEAQMLLANSYASDANIRNYMIFRDDVYGTYSERDMLSFIEKNNYIESIYLTDIEGNVLITTSDVLRNMNMANIRPDLWKKLSSGEKTTFGGIRESPVSGEMTLGVGTIVTDFTNNTIGYLVTTIKGSVIHDNYFSKVKLGRTGRIVAVNEDFIVTMDMDTANINKPAPAEYKNIFNNALDEGPYSYKNGNILRMGYYKKMTVQPWIVTYAMNEDEIFEQIRTTIIVSVLAAAASIIVLVIFMFMYARRITKPLSIVVEEAKEIEEGRLVMHGRKVNRKDEIGELSRSFHNMKYKLIEII